MAGSDETQGFYDQIHAEQARFILGSRSRGITDTDLFNAARDGAGATAIENHYRERVNLAELQDELIAHRINDALGTGIKHYKSIGTRTIRAYIRREIAEPAMIAIELGELWKFKAGLYQLPTEGGRTPLQLLRMREMFEAERANAQHRGKWAVADEKAADAGIAIIDRTGDGLLSELGQRVYADLIETLGPPEDPDNDPGE